MHLYDRFIGRWEAEAQAFLTDGSSRRHYWQIRFERVLEGRAIQDVWITPPRDGPNVGRSERWGPFDNQYGMTLRVYDAKLDAYRVEGKGSDGTLLRWIFSDLQPDRFRWRAELSRDEGARWHKAIEMLAHKSKEP